MAQSVAMNFLLEQLVDASFRPHFERLLNLISIDGVTDVLANACDDWWIDRGQQLERVDKMVIPNQQYQELARFLIALGDRHLDIISPATDASISRLALPVLTQLGVERLRVHAVLESEVSDFTLLSIRIHRAQELDLGRLLDLEMITEIQRLHLRQILARRQNFVVSGGAGTGKTTLLRAMLAESSHLRTVVIEDSFELVPLAGHVVGMQSRQANTEGAGRVELAALAREALRMRPDRIVIGEVRGAEVEVLLNAMNTGHAGSAATVHANRASQVFSRLKSLALLSGHTDESFRLAAESAVDWVLHLELVDGKRKLVEIEEFAA